jgi:NAD(P)H-nitrite reductase large subunit
MHYIIIGAGPAGIVAAETLRKNDPDADISIISGEAEPPYSRMAIPYFLEGKIEQQGSYLRDPEQFYSANNIQIIQDRVEHIDPASHQLRLAEDTELHYDKLLIASGSSPFTPPIPGRDHERVSSCWTLQDARKIIELANPGSSVVLIGAGFIGCIILESLVKRGVHLTVIETGNRMVPRMLNDKAGGLLKTWCEQKGVKVETSCSVESITDGDNGGVQVKLSNGHQISADLIITATGVKANTSFIADSGLTVDQGILVNDYLQTSDPDIYAAGDVAQALDFSTGQYQVQAIQPTATDHGRIAALNMCGKKAQHHGSINMNVLDTLGLISCSFGLWMGVEGGESVEIYNEADFKYLNLQFDGDVLIGASSTGMTQHVGVLRGLIESKLKLGVWKDRLLKEPTHIMEAYMACTQELG